MFNFSCFFGALPFNHSSVKTKLWNDEQRPKKSGKRPSFSKVYCTLYNLEKVTKGWLSRIFCTERGGQITRVKNAILKENCNQNWLFSILCIEPLNRLKNLDIYSLQGVVQNCDRSAILNIIFPAKNNFSFNFGAKSYFEI